MRIYVVDAFTDAAFGGNPAGVCLVDEERDDAWMQSVAAEMRHSETAFLRRGPDGFGLRWFTPTTEVELCGHATLASAHVVWTEGVAPVAPLRFHTASGVLTRAGRRGRVDRARLSRRARGGGRAGAGAARRARDRHGHLGGAQPVRLRGRGSRRRDRERPRPGHDRTRPRARPRGRRDRARRGPRPRFRLPLLRARRGHPREPGDRLGALLPRPLWGARLGKAELVGRQLSAHGGVVRVRPAGDRVVLGGQAVTVVRGELAV